MSDIFNLAADLLDPDPSLLWVGQNGTRCHLGPVDTLTTSDASGNTLTRYVCEGIDLVAFLT